LTYDEVGVDCGAAKLVPRNRLRFRLLPLIKKYHTQKTKSCRENETRRRPLELQRSRTRTMGVGRGLVALSAAAAAPLTHITSHNKALQLSMRSSSRASRQHADTRQACNNRRARTVQRFSSACAVPSHLPSTPSHAHTERSCTEHAGSEHASPDALRVAQQQRGTGSMPTQQETSRCTDRSHAA
jgi:hypothetical protein